MATRLVAKCDVCGKMAPTDPQGWKYYHANDWADRSEVIPLGRGHFYCPDCVPDIAPRKLRDLWEVLEMLASGDYVDELSADWTEPSSRVLQLSFGAYPDPDEWGYNEMEKWHRITQVHRDDQKALAEVRVEILEGTPKEQVIANITEVLALLWNEYERLADWPVKGQQSEVPAGTHVDNSSSVDDEAPPGSVEDTEIPF